MDKRIERANSECEVLINFVAEYKGSLDDKGVKELQSIDARLGEFVATTGQSRDGVAKSRTLKKQSFDRLQGIVIECKKTMEICGVRGGKVEVPKLNGSLWVPTRIGELALKYLDAARSANDPAVTKSATALQSAYDDFLATRSEINKKVISTRSFKKGMKTELDEIIGKLAGYATFIAYHVGADARAQLFDRPAGRPAAQAAEERRAAGGRCSGDGHVEGGQCAASGVPRDPRRDRRAPELRAPGRFRERVEQTPDPSPGLKPPSPAGRG